MLAVDGNRLVYRDQRGTHEITVPDDFRMKVDGKQMAVKELKPGMKGTATVTTTTTITPVTVTEVKQAVVVSATPTSVLIRGADGVQRRFTQSELDKRGIEIFKDGQLVRVSQLNPGDQLTATIVSSEPPTHRDRDGGRREDGGGQGRARSGQGRARSGQGRARSGQGRARSGQGGTRGSRGGSSSSSRSLEHSCGAQRPADEGGPA